MESESSEFGLSAGTDKHEAAAPAHRVHGKQAQPGQEVKREDGRERKDAKDGNDGKPATDPSKLNKDTALTSATTVLQSIKQLTPAAVWKGTFKENEIKARLKKAGVALTDLEQYQATLGDSESNEKEKENCASVLSQMGSVVDTVPLLQEVVKELRGKKVMESLYLEEFQAVICERCLISSPLTQTPFLRSSIAWPAKSLRPGQHFLFSLKGVKELNFKL